MSLAKRHVPVVSVLMTVFNAEAYLKKSLESLSIQEFEDFEVIVLEHGSTDNSAAILRSWGDSRLVLERLPMNIGRTRALNFCLERASGRYVAILDADDLAHRQRLAAGVEFLEKNNNVGLLATWTKFINEDGIRIGSSHPPTSHRDLIRELAIRNPIVHSSMMFRRSIAAEIGGYNVSYQYAQDFELLIEFAKRSNLMVLDQELCVWRKATSNMTSNSEFNIARAFDEYRIFKKVSNDVDLAGLSRMLNWKQRFITFCIFRIRLLGSGYFKPLSHWINEQDLIFRQDAGRN